MVKIIGWIEKEKFDYNLLVGVVFNELIVKFKGNVNVEVFVLKYMK